MSRSEASKEVSRRLSREAKQRRRGICEDCGAKTRYNGHGVARWCRTCGPKHAGLANQGNGPLQRRLYALLDAGMYRFTDLQRSLGIRTDHMGTMLNRELKWGRIERFARGHYRRVPDA